MTTAMATRADVLRRLFERQIVAVDADLLGAAAALARPGAVTRRLARRALAVRLAVGLALALSSAWLPDFGGGDASVATFDLRTGSDCFARAGSFCACRHRRDGGMCGWNETSDGCAPTGTRPHNGGALQTTVYPFLLRPLTRWDAARFLRLAHTPQLYWPKAAADGDDAWAESEPASAFLPFYPRVVQRMAALLLDLLPLWLIPGTCEQTLALAAALVNALCFVVSAAALFQLTYRLLEAHQLARHKKDESDGADPTDDDNDDAITWGTRATLLFLLNPANVFFGAAYSEALCGALILAGALLLTSASAGQALLARGLWLLAARTRSNGALYLGYLLLRDAGAALRQRSLGRLLWGVAMAWVGLLLSLRFHNLRGVIRHCYATDDIGRGPLGLVTWCARGGPRRPADPRPDWCRATDDGAGGCLAPFNLYVYVQRKYWNVGFLRYFTLKQVPNFLLAAPILVIAVAAVVTWIRNSWMRFHKRRNKHIRHNFVRRFLAWTMDSLQSFASDAPSQDVFNSHADVLVGSNAVLGHYAVLCAAAGLGFFVAHVQISTRLLCSTCPAVYWYMAVLVSRRDAKQRWTGQWILGYFLLYNVLGVIMHPNWLPWT